LPPPDEVLDYNLVSVETALPGVASAHACDPWVGGWYLRRIAARYAELDGDV